MRALAVADGRARLLCAASRFMLALCALTALIFAPEALAKGGKTPVDVELVFAVDISYSMDPEEQRLQRDGYIKALTSPEFLQALKSGAHGRIAIAYMQWASSFDQDVLIPWTIIDGAETARAVAERLSEAPYRRARRTSISGAIDAAVKLFDDNGFDGVRRVIDISGDGSNNDGRLVTTARDEAVRAGYVINGLPLLIRPSNWGFADIANLDEYYEDCVIGGPGSFVIPIKGRDNFVRATRTKLLMEIASLPAPSADEFRIIPAQDKGQDRQPRVSCTVGEQMWRDRWGR